MHFSDCYSLYDFESFYKDMAQLSVPAFINLVSVIVEVDEADPAITHLLQEHLDGLESDNRNLRLKRLPHMFATLSSLRGSATPDYGSLRKAGGETRRFRNAPNSRTSQILNNLSMNTMRIRDQDEEGQQALKKIWSDGSCVVAALYQAGLQFKGVSAQSRSLYNKTAAQGGADFLWAPNGYLTVACSKTSTFSGHTI